MVPDVLSPLDPTPPSFLSQSTSPPIGRNSRSKRKERSPLGSPIRAKSFRSGSNEDDAKKVATKVSKDVERKDDAAGKSVTHSFENTLILGQTL